MIQVVLYKQDSGGIAVIRPSQEALAIYSIQAIALKDVPPGKPFKILNVSELPQDRSQRDLWDIDEALLTDGIGNQSNTFEEI